MRTLVALLALGLAASACKSHPPIPEGAAVLIKPGHYHTKYCGHYVFGTQWYFIAQHKHGVDCGHELVGDNWTLVE